MLIPARPFFGVAPIAREQRLPVVEACPFETGESRDQINQTLPRREIKDAKSAGDIQADPASTATPS